MTRIRDFFKGRPIRLMAFIAPVVGIAAFFIYSSTAFHEVYPGQSAREVVTLGGLASPDHVSDPIYSLVMRLIARLPGDTLPARLNLACAVFGALAAVGFFWLLARLFFIFGCENPGGIIEAMPLNGQESDDDDDAPGYDDDDDAPPAAPAPAAPSPEPESADSLELIEQHDRAARAAVLGGLGATVLFAFSAPFWTAATRCYPMAFHAFALFLILNAIVTYWQTEQVGALLWATFLLCAFWLEAPVFFLVFILGGGALLALMRQQERLTFNRTLGFVIVGAAGGLVSLACLWKAAAYVVPWTPSIRLTVSNYLATASAELVQMVPNAGWPYYLLELALPLALACFLVPAAFHRRSWFLFAVELALAACLVPAMLNIDRSIWGVARTTSRLPILAYGITAILLGLLISIWHLMRDTFLMADDEDLDDYEYRDNPVICKIGSFLCWPLLALACFAPFRSYPDIRPAEASFIDAIAEDVYRELGTRDWLIDNSLVRDQLIVKASEHGRPLHFLMTGRYANPASDGRLHAAILSDERFAPYRTRLLNAADLSPEQFIAAWAEADSNACSRLAIFRNPGVLRRLGYSVVPQGFFLVGVRSLKPGEAAECLARYRAFSEKWRSELFPVRPDTIQLFADFRRGVRRHLAFIGNELGCLLINEKEWDAAGECFREVEALDPHSISVILNRYWLAKKKAVQASDLPNIESRLEAIPNEADIFGLTASRVQSDSGTLASPAILELARKNFWTRDRLYRQLAETKAKKPSGTALDPLSALREKKAELYNAITKNIDRSDFAEAESQVNILLDVDDHDLFALVRKMEFAVRKNDFSSAAIWMELAKKNGATPADLAWFDAASLVAAGKDDEAYAHIQKILPSALDDMRLLELAARILMRKHNTYELSNRIYPAVRAAAANKDHYLQYELKGYLIPDSEPVLKRAAYLRALELNPELDNVRETVLRLDAAIDVPLFSEQDARAMLQRRPDNSFANYLLGDVYLRRGSLDQAEDLFGRSLRRNPESAYAYLGLAGTRLAAKNPAEAARLVRQALEHTDGTPLVNRAIARLAFEAGDLDTAEPVLKDLLVKSPGDIELAVLDARLSFARHNLPEASKKISSLLGQRDRLTGDQERQLRELSGRIAEALAKGN